MESWLAAYYLVLQVCIADIDIEVIAAECGWGVMLTKIGARSR